MMMVVCFRQKLRNSAREEISTTIVLEDKMSFAVNLS